MSSDGRLPDVPGTRLRVIALRLFGRQTAERFLDPVIADLQHEIRAVSLASPARRWLVTARAYVAFWQAAACALLSANHQNVRMTLGVAGAALAAVVTITTVLMIDPVLRMAPVLWKRLGVDASIELVALLQPQALAVAVPVAVLFAGFLACERRALQSRATIAVSVAAISLLAAVTSMVIILWAVPAANQAFREKVASGMGITLPLKKSAAEMTVSELLEARGLAEGDFRRQATYDFHRHQKFAIPFASVAFGLVTIAFRHRRALRHPILMSGLLTVLVTAVYYVLFMSGRLLTLRHGFPPWAGAWGANLVFAAAALCVVSRRLARTSA